MTTLAIETVGTQAVQGGLFDEFVATTIGPGARVIGGRIGEELAKLSDADLIELIEDDVLRNGACYERLDRSEAEDGWTLALIATDQEPAHDSDTIGIARAVARWLRLVRPRVRVLDPYAIRMRPDQATDALAEAIDAHIRAAVTQVKPDHLVVLAVGGTPAMRLLAERSVGLLAPKSGEPPLRLMPDGRGGTLEGGLLRIIEADHVREVLLARLRDAFFSARYRAAEEIARDMDRLGLLADNRVAEWCRVAQRIATREPTWIDRTAPSLPAKPVRRLDRIRVRGHEWGGMLLATIAVVERMERDGRRLDALTPYVAAAELIVLAWALEVVGVEPKALRAVPGPADGCLPRARPDEHKNLTDIARNAALCAKRHCAECPLAGEAGGTAAAKLRTDAAAGLANALRDTGPGKLTRLRNKHAHPRMDRTATAVEDAISVEVRALRKLGVDTPDDGLGLADILRAVYEKLTGDQAADPLTVVEDEVRTLLDR